MGGGESNSNTVVRGAHANKSDLMERKLTGCYQSEFPMHGFLSQ